MDRSRKARWVHGGRSREVRECRRANRRRWRELLALFNPFPDDVIVDITFTTPEGVRSPPEFDGFVIPGQRVIAIDVGAVVSRHPQVSASIVARTGRLVVERLQSFDGTDGPATCP